MIGLEHQYGHRFIVFGHQYGGCDVMWKLYLLLRGCVGKREHAARIYSMG